MLLPIHIVAGGLAIILGAVALLAAKGATLHRRSGLLFVYAMLTMGISGSILALRQSLTNPNEIGMGFKALGNADGTLNGVPFFMPFFLAVVTTLAAVGDVRVLRSGAMRGAPRLARHLWRMCFALFIAAGSFFSIRERVAKVLPDPFTTPMMRALPIVLVFVAMFYWLWRIRGRRMLPQTR
jgi:hypothetical protein